MSTNTKYCVVIGLEVHIELNTSTKIFCRCKRGYGYPPNTLICPVCTGHPGTLPSLNKKAVEYAIAAGLATECQINPVCKMSRKHYFYPDLPKGYQLSQAEFPICHDGRLTIEDDNGAEKHVGIIRIHIEEDAGKLIHRDGMTLIDHNRCGVPLIEIVSRPELSSSGEAMRYLQKLRTLMIYLGISQCKMNQGEMRCDVNISLKPQGQAQNGTRCEIKNINSIQYVGKAIENEICRQTEILEKGDIVKELTLGFDDKTASCYIMREKEGAADYRYIDEPDILPFFIDPSHVEQIQKRLPTLPRQRIDIYRNEYHLSQYDSSTLVQNKEVSDYFELTIAFTKNYKQLVNLLLGEYLRLNDQEDFSCPIPPEQTAKLCDLAADERINSSNFKKIAAIMWKDGKDPVTVMKENNMEQINSYTELLSFVEAAVSASDKLVDDYIKGKTKAAKAIMGKAMALSGGNANPKKLEEILERHLKELTSNN